ncbi:MAG: glutaredoxin domain-containing protein [Verrucomicrobiota bacterium]
MPQIDIYYAEVCGLCHKAMDFFRSRELEFTAYEVEWDAEADAFVDGENTRAMMRRCGEDLDFVPQIFINGTHIAGWRKLEPMIESGALDALVEAQP